MRPNPVDHSLWLAIGHAARLDPHGFVKPSEQEVQACLDLIARALAAGADPNAEFTLPSQQGERLHLSCMERAFGQLHGAFLVPLLRQAIETGWRADRLPSGLWATGQRVHDNRDHPPRPEQWRLQAATVEGEPGWLQLVAQGRPWGASASSAELCRLLVSAGAPFFRPAQAHLEAADEQEATLAYRELRDPLRLAVARGGNLDVAMALVQAGALESWNDPEAVEHLVREVEFSSAAPDDAASSLISLLKSHAQAIELDRHAAVREGAPTHAPRRSL